MREVLNEIIESSKAEDRRFVLRLAGITRFAAGAVVVVTWAFGLWRFWSGVTMGIKWQAAEAIGDGFVSVVAGVLLAMGMLALADGMKILVSVEQKLGRIADALDKGEVEE
jgi:hypothetical protein